MVSTQPPDPLREAMARVRDGHVTGTQHAAPTPGLRARLTSGFAGVQEPGAVVWPSPVAGLVAGAWASAMSMLSVGLLVLAVWVFAPLGSGTLADVARVSAAGWLVAGGGEVRWSGAVLSLPPLLLTMLLLAFQRRAGRWLVAASAAERVLQALPALLFAVAASASAQVLVANLLTGQGLVVPMLRSAVGAALVAVIGFAWGAHRELAPEWPPQLVLVARALRAFGLSLVIGASALLLVLAVSRRQQFTDVLTAVAGDSTSVMQLLLLCACYLPTLVVWVAAVTVGPGFTVGLGTHVTLHSVLLGALPPVPLFALLPERMLVQAPLLMVVPLLAAGVAVWRARTDRSLLVRLGLLTGTMLIGLIAGVATSGGIGPARLSMVGTAALPLALAATGWMLASVLLDVIGQAVRNRAARTASEAEVPGPAEGAAESSAPAE